MPTVHSVNDITERLSNIIQSESTLQNVEVQGEVVLVDDSTTVFFLRHEGRSLRCYIPGGGTAQFRSLLRAGNTVVVNGNIGLFSAVNQYQFLVQDMQSLRNGRMESQSLSVSEITTELSNIIENRNEFQDICVQGQILQSPPGLHPTILTLGNGNGDEADFFSKIQCRLSNPCTEEVGDGVCVRGRIRNFNAEDGVRYQIEAAEIEPYPSQAQCQCPGCDRCGRVSQCNRPREVANFESCATCLPLPPDELYELCPECYADSPDHETRVAEEVYAYFDRLGVNGFSPDREFSIQIGARNGRADVVLADGNGSLAAITECKGAGYVGHGIEQLKSYLSATDTRFGIFANRTDPEQWKFYENRRRNQIDPIDRSEFEASVGEPPSSKSTNPSRHLWQYITGVLGVALCICLTVLIMQLDEKNRQIKDNTRTITQLKNDNIRLTEKNRQIKDNTKAISQLTNKIETLANENQALQEQITEKDKQLEEYTGKNLKLESEIADLREQITKKPPKPGPGKLPPPPKPIPKLLNINTATAKELDDLPVPGIGEKLSERIIQFRKQNGNFATVDDITKVPGIGEKTLENLRKFIRAE